MTGYMPDTSEEEQVAGSDDEDISVEDRDLNVGAETNLGSDGHEALSRLPIMISILSWSMY